MTTQKLELALDLHREGQLAAAARLYREILDEDGENADAWHLLGMVAHQSGDAAAAAGFIRRAISISPGFADYHNNLADVHDAQGDYGAAEASCREAIRLRPDFVQAHHNLGNALLRQRRFSEAIECYEEALRLNPAYARALLGSSQAWRHLGEFERAIASCNRALEIDPGSHEALNHRGAAQLTAGRFTEALDSFRQAFSIRPDSAEAVNGAGNALQKLERWEEAIACHQQAIGLRPGYVEAHTSLGVAFRQCGQFELSEQSFRRALSYRPDDARVHNDLGELLWRKGERNAAEACFRRALQIMPELAIAHFNLANALFEAKRWDEAEQSYRDALVQDAELSAAMTNLAICLSDQGRTEEAMTWFAKAHQQCRDARTLSHLLVCRQYLTGNSPDSVKKAHAAWNEHAAHLSPTAWPRLESRAGRGRRLRIGLVSRDFRLHPVGYFLAGTLEALHRDRLEVICYADQPQADAMTERIRAAADRWVPVNGISDDELARRVREDKIDILVDLAGHTAGNRLLVFARKPAPVQVSWMGYVGTTGLAAIDFLLSDRFHTPAGSDAHFTEQVVRLPDGYVCYTPPDDAPPVGPLPVLRNGYVTFGCFNYPAKISVEAMSLWARILQQQPESRLLLKFTGLESRGAKKHFVERFAALGIGEERIVLEGGSPHAELLDRYNSVDIALDTLPYAGGLTTCEALWMGVPVVTLPGATFASRHSYSHLSNAGFAELIADSPQGYVERAVRRATDVSQLVTLRKDLRERTAMSPLCDARRFAGSLEEALLKMWQARPDT